MLPRRRIFRPASSPRPWRGAVIVVALGLVGTALVGLPADLFGSAPRPEARRIPAAEIRVVDGETLRLRDRTVRLAGVDAPERGEPCLAPAGTSFDCGAAATEALVRLIGGLDLTCRMQGRDRGGREEAVCEAGGAELNLALVAGGWALAGGETLRGAEAMARRSGNGFWAAGTTAPEAWRRRP